MKLLAVIAVWFCAGFVITGTIAQMMQTLATRTPSQDVLMAAQIQLSAQRAAFGPVMAGDILSRSK